MIKVCCVYRFRHVHCIKYNAECLCTYSALDAISRHGNLCSLAARGGSARIGGCNGGSFLSWFSHRLIRRVVPIFIALALFGALSSCTHRPPVKPVVTSLNQAALIDAQQDFGQAPRPGYVLDAEQVDRPPTIAPTGVIIIGDSIITGWSGYIAHVFPNALINGRVGRQFSSALHIWAMMHVNHQTRNVGYVVIELGTNGYVDPKQVAQFMSMVGQRQVFFVVPEVPRPWQTEVQDLYIGLPRDYPNVHLVRWDLLSENHPDYFWTDGVHPNWTGIQVMVQAIAHAIAKYQQSIHQS